MKGDSSFDEELQRLADAFRELSFAAGSLIIEGLIEGFTVYRWPLWFVYFILGGSLILITLVLGI